MLGPVPKVIAHQRANSARSARAAVASAVASFSAAPSVRVVPAGGAGERRGDGQAVGEQRRRARQKARRVGRRAGAETRRAIAPRPPPETPRRAPALPASDRACCAPARRLRRRRAPRPRRPAANTATRRRSAGLQPSKRDLGLQERDLHRRAGVLAGEFSELPLAREHPERILYRGRKAPPRVAATADRLDPGRANRPSSWLFPSRPSALGTGWRCSAGAHTEVVLVELGEVDRRQQAPARAAPHRGRPAGSARAPSASSTTDSSASVVQGLLVSGGTASRITFGARAPGAARLAVTAPVPAAYGTTSVHASSSMPVTAPLTSSPTRTRDSSPARRQAAQGTAARPSGAPRPRRRSSS